MKNEVILSFGIWGFNDISHNEITKSLDLKPSKVYIKGERKNSKFTAIAKENGWLFRPTENVYASFECQLADLIRAIEPKIDIIKDYSRKYKCEISCAVYLYFDNEESTPSIHFNSNYNRLIRELDIEFDLDLYCLPH